MNVLQIIVVTIYTIVAAFYFFTEIYAIVWRVYDRKKPCCRCQYHRAVSRYSPCEICGVKHELFVDVGE